jgi:cob(I)alamin adenosyltransferase
LNIATRRKYLSCAGDAYSASLLTQVIHLLAGTNLSEVEGKDADYAKPITLGFPRGSPIKHYDRDRRILKPATLTGEQKMSIATKRGDGGETGLVGGVRISKADLRVEAYGSIDELNTVLGFARSICKDKQIAEWTETIQRTLFRVGAALATPAVSENQPPVLSTEDIDRLTDLVHKIEATEGILSDWSLPGAHTESAAYEIARTVCRRAERAAVRLVEDGGMIQPAILPYLNRLSDTIWLFGRLIELNAGIESRLRPESKGGPKWSRAW